MSKIIISVIVPFYNEEEKIKKCAESLMNQNFNKENYEIIFIDNNSNDKSKDIVKTFPEITYLFEPEQGRYAARNKGLAIAKGNIIAFTDSDCAVDTHWLESIYAEFSKKGTQIVLGSNFYSSPKSVFLEFWEFIDNERIKFIILNKIKKRYYAYASNMAIKRQVFNDVGSFNKTRGEDTEYLMRCLKIYPDLKIKILDNEQYIILDSVGINDSFYRFYQLG